MKTRVRVKKSSRDAHRMKLKNIVNAFKEHSGCVDCRREYDAMILECHHINPQQKSFTVARGVAYGCSFERMRDELKKCVVLCANCHRRREHYRQLEKRDRGVKKSPYETLPGMWENKRKIRPNRETDVDESDTPLPF